MSRLWERNKDVDGLASGEDAGCCDVTEWCSNALFWVPVLLAEFSNRAKDGGIERCAKESGFIVSERGCICSVCGLESCEGEASREGEEGGESNKLPSEEGGLAQLPSPCM